MHRFESNNVSPVIGVCRVHMCVCVFHGSHTASRKRAAFNAHCKNVDAENATFLCLLLPFAQLYYVYLGLRVRV